MGTTIDSFYIDKQTLLPVKRVVNQRQMDVKLEFMPDKITGSMQVRGRTQNINIEKDKKVLGIPEVTGRAMAFGENFEASFNMLNLMKQSLQTFSMKVSGSETVEVPGGQFDCYKVNLDSSEGGTPEQTLFFTVKEPHRLIKAINELPASMGGVTVVSELKEMK